MARLAMATFVAIASFAMAYISYKTAITLEDIPRLVFGLCSLVMTAVGATTLVAYINTTTTQG